MSYLNWTSLFAPLCYILGGNQGMKVLVMSLGAAFAVEFVFRFCAKWKEVSNE